MEFDKKEHVLAGPVNKIRVVDLSRFIAGPYCAMLLADMGAEVIKIEPLSGDDTRKVSKDLLIGGESSLFMSLNRNKRSICIDLSKDEGKKIFFKLVKSADVVIENYMPGKTEALGIDYETVKSANPKIIYCSISAFGNSGPYMKRPGLDMVVQAMSGIMAITGEPDGRPMRPGFNVVDATSAIMAAYGIVIGLFQRQKSGKGMEVSLSLLDHAIAIQTTIACLYFLKNVNPPRLGNASPYTLAQDFKTKDGRYITLSIGNDRFWQKFRKILGVQGLIDDPRFESLENIFYNMEDLVNICQKRFLEKDGKEWEELLIEGGIPCGLVNTYEEVFNDKQVQHNRMILELNHPTTENIRLLRSPLKLDNKIMTGMEMPPPLLGEHTREILSEIGYEDEAIDSLEPEGVIKCANLKQLK